MTMCFLILYSTRRVARRETVSSTENEMSHIANVKLLSRVYHTVELHHILPFFHPSSAPKHNVIKFALSSRFTHRYAIVCHHEDARFRISTSRRYSRITEMRCRLESAKYGDVAKGRWRSAGNKCQIIVNNSTMEFNYLSLAPISPHFSSNRSCHQMPQSGDGLLNFTAIRRDDSGWYKCTARHLNKPYSSFGYFLNVRCEY